MKTNKNRQEQVESTFKVIDSIQEVKVSPFFKDKTMNLLFKEKEPERVFFSWFTPNLQFAALVSIVVLNVFVLTQLGSDGDTGDLDEFAQSYDLSITDEDSIFN